MIETPLLALGGSSLLFLVLYLLTYYEYVQKRRFAAPLRIWLDGVVDSIVVSWHQAVTHVTRYILQLGWYYSIHSILRATLIAMVESYHALEAVFERNRARTKQLRREIRERKQRTHLDEMHDHKTSTALSDAEKRRLRKRGL
jgi:hypothetical protein